MISLLQPTFFKHPCVGVKLPVASYLSNIMRLSAPIRCYNNDIMRGVFRLIIETFQDCDDTVGPTFRKNLYILEDMAMIRLYEIMFDIECDNLIL